MLTHNGFVAAMQVLLDCYPNRKLNAGQSATWFELLKDMTDGELKAAVALHCRNGDDWPTPAKLRRSVGRIDSVIAPEDRAVIAWGVVRQAIQTVGSYEAVNFDDPVVNAVVRQMGGWPELCDTAPDEMKWKRREFEMTYRAICRIGTTADYCRSLDGIHARVNRLTGHGLREPRQLHCGLPSHDTKLIRGKLASTENREIPESVKRLALAVGDGTEAN